MNELRDASGAYQLDRGQALMDTPHAWLSGLMPSSPCAVLVLDDPHGLTSQAFAKRGDQVLRVISRGTLNLELVAGVSSIHDHLPALAEIHRQSLAFDVIVVGPSWIALTDPERERALRKLVTLLRAGGVLSLQLGSNSAERISKTQEIERLALTYGAQVHQGPTLAGSLTELAPAASTPSVALRLADDGTGAMPLLRHLIVNDDKSSTYKLALIRALCRIADGMSGLAQPAGEDHVELPMGLVGLVWLRLFKPLLEADLPQMPGHRHFAGLGFVKPAYLKTRGVSGLDLRIGARFEGDLAAYLHTAIKDACDTITRMPVKYSRYRQGGQIFEVRMNGPRRAPSAGWVLDLPALWSFGAFRMPKALWQCLTRNEVWIEPALVQEWIRLMREYAKGQNRLLDPVAMERAMTWADPARDVAQARSVAIHLVEQRRLHCVWTGQRLSADSLDMDHCIPWSTWPCDALWNLMPAHRQVNQRQKRDRLPTDQLLLRSSGAIQQWWSDAWFDGSRTVHQGQFAEEARATLPGLMTSADPATTDELPMVFQAMRLQRMRIQVNHQCAEWSGPYPIGPSAR